MPAAADTPPRKATIAFTPAASERGLLTTTDTLSLKSATALLCRPSSKAAPPASRKGGSCSDAAAPRDRAAPPFSSADSARLWLPMGAKRASDESPDKPERASSDLLSGRRRREEESQMGRRVLECTTSS